MITSANIGIIKFLQTALTDLAGNRRNWKWSNQAALSGNKPANKISKTSIKVNSFVRFHVK